MENRTPSAAAAAKAVKTSVGVAATNPRPASSTRVIGFTVATSWIQPLQQRQRHVDRGEEEHEEHGHLHDRAGLHRPQPHRDAGGPRGGGEVDHDRERVEPEQIDAAPADLHPHGERDRGQDRDGDEPAPEGGGGVAEDDAAAVRRRQQQPPREAALEVACDPEAGEDTRERRGLDDDERELKRRVALREREARRARDPGQTPGEGGEEEEREDERGDQQRLVVREVVQAPPRDALSDREAVHERASLPFSELAARAMATTAIVPAIPKPSASASPSQPITIRLRTPSIR